MSPEQLAQEALGLGELGLEAFAQALLPKLPIVQLIGLVNSIAALIEAKSRPEQVSDAEKAIIAADDLAEAEAAPK